MRFFIWLSRFLHDAAINRFFCLLRFLKLHHYLQYQEVHPSHLNLRYTIDEQWMSVRKKNREKKRKVQDCLDYRVNILLLLQEFHFETMARATHNAESASVASTEVSHQVASIILDSWYPVLVQFSLTDIFQSAPFFLLLSWQGNQWKPYLTEPKPPLLHTLLRARPTQVKSSLEIEKEELEKIPKFKAKPLNKKVLSSPFFSFGVLLFFTT